MKQKICVVSMIAILATIAGFALCDQSGASQADQDLWNQHVLARLLLVAIQSL